MQIPSPLDTNASEADKSLPKLHKPSEVKTFLDQYVIGQESAKRAVAVAVYNHYKRILSNYTEDDVEFQNKVGFKYTEHSSKSSPTAFLPIYNEYKPNITR